MQRASQVPPLPMACGEGPWLRDFEGRRYFDATSSWWVNLFGHADARINAALKDQLDRLPHVMLVKYQRYSLSLVRMRPANDGISISRRASCHLSVMRSMSTARTDPTGGLSRAVHA
jgi:hypothetical protein